MTPHSDIGTLYFLDLSGGRMVAVRSDGTGLWTILPDVAGDPDGIIVDASGGHLYWTNMGDLVANDGSIERADMDGGNLVVIVAPGETFTPKRIQLHDGKLYWSDREGMRVMRANLDGSDIESLIETGHGETDRADQRNWCVGVAVGALASKVYWTQKGPDKSGQGRIFRASGRMFITDLAGSVYAATINGASRTTLLQVQGNRTGIAYAPVWFDTPSTTRMRRHAISHRLTPAWWEST